MQRQHDVMCIHETNFSQVETTYFLHEYLQGQCQANKVHHHLLIGQLHAEETQQSEEGLVVFTATALLLTAQVDVSVELLSVL